MIEQNLCECGCGGYVKPGNRFINGHNARGLKRSDETREKMCIATKKRFKDNPVTDETKRKMRDSRLEYFDKPGSREANSKSQKKRFKDNPVTDETKKKSSLSQKKVQGTPEARKANSERGLKRFEDPKEREKQSIAGKERFEDPKELEKQSERGLKRWSDSKEREKAIERSRQIHVNDPTIGYRISASHQNQDFYKGEWTGYTDKARPHLIPYHACIKLNPCFEGCNQHHITSGVIINIPVDLHESIRHSMPTEHREGKNMAGINELALNYLIGNLN